MTSSQSAITYWVNQFNLEAGLLASQQAATLAEHNARYVNGAGTGPTWAAQDAADVAAAASAASSANAALAAEVTLYNNSQSALAAETTLYNNSQAALAAEVTLYNNSQAALASETALYNAQVTATAAATPPAALDLVTGSNISTTFGSSIQEMMRLTVDRTGYWVAAGWLSWANSIQEGGDFSTTLGLSFNGTTQFTTSFVCHANDKSGGGGVMSTSAILLTNGQTISLYANKGFSLVVATAAQALRAYFVPTAAYPK